MKTNELWFKEWEQRTFGAGYGTGEQPILIAVKAFFNLLKDGHSYNFETLEKELGSTITWLLINAFNNANMIEWGTSARFGWLTSSGHFVYDFFKTHSINEMYNIAMSSDTVCLCEGDLKGHVECGNNPFVNEKVADSLR